MVIAIDLRPDRDLLDPCFETYRLEAKPLEIIETKLEARVSCAELSPDKFGLCHVQLQLKHNALITDDFDPGLLFYVSRGELHRLVEAASSPSVGCETRKESIVHRLSTSTTTASVRFLSENHAVILEPSGTLSVVVTGARVTSQKFVEIFSFESGLQDAVVVDAMEFAQADGFAVHLIICSVRDDGDKKRGPSCLDWLVLEGPSATTSEKNKWSLVRRHQLHGKAVPKFTKLLVEGCDSESFRLLVCADCRYRADIGSDDSKQLVEGDRTSAPLYTYVQDETEVIATFVLETGVSKNDVRVIISPHKIQLEIKDVTVIDSRLHDDVDPGCSVWCIVDSKLEITLIKKTEARWPRLLVNDDRGEEIFDPTYAAAVHSRLQHLTTTEQDTACASSLIDSDRGENCDEPPDEFHIEVFSATDESLERVGCADMTGREHIMDIWSNEGLQTVLRHDVDGLVWKFHVSDDGLVQAKHIHTISAFGYVVASKRDRVLLTGCLEAGYTALVDAKNNVFIYEHQTKGEPKKTVLNEYVLPLRQGATNVIGGRMCSDKLLLLTSDTLFAITLPA